jgi:hypothetical protein
MLLRIGTETLFLNEIRNFPGEILCVSWEQKKQEIVTKEQMEIVFHVH